MENAVEALKMAFAVFVFIIALTVGITVFTQARQSSEVILTAQDDTRYYEYIPGSIFNEDTGEWESTGDTRIVGLETVIPTLYKYYKENYTVVFLEKDGTPLTLYETQTEPRTWSGSDLRTNSIASIVSKYYDGILDNHIGIQSNDRNICAFDIDDETKRHEPWTGNPDIDVKRNLDAFLNGSDFTYESSSGSVINRSYSYDGFIRDYSDQQFIEMQGEYNYDVASTTQTPDEETNTFGAYEDTVKNKKKRVIIYQKYN